MSIDYQRFEKKKKWIGDKADYFNIRGKGKPKKIKFR